jgi:hypothetical protein
MLTASKIGQPSSDDNTLCMSKEQEKARPQKQRLSCSKLLFKDQFVNLFQG